MSALEVITTTVAPRSRSISLLLANGETLRYALVSRPNGDVHWVVDRFTCENVGEPLQWAAHHGRLTVGDVVTHLPHCARDIIRWTREEIESGPDADGGDIFARDTRRRALDRLAVELRAGEQAA